MKPRYRFEDSNGRWECEECGAVVSVRSKHDAWHNSVLTADALAQALETR